MAPKTWRGYYVKIFVMLIGAYLIFYLSTIFYVNEAISELSIKNEIDGIGIENMQWQLLL